MIEKSRIRNVLDGQWTRFDRILEACERLGLKGAANHAIGVWLGLSTLLAAQSLINDLDQAKALTWAGPVTAFVCLVSYGIHSIRVAFSDLD